MKPARVRELRSIASLLAAAVAVLVAGVSVVSGQFGDGPTWSRLALPTDTEWVNGPETNGANLLVNGGLNGDYYWAYPNHYTAPDWRRWWIDGTILPEYDRSRGTEPYIEGDRSQRMHKWGVGFQSGIYQVASVSPCVTYELSGWIRADSGKADAPNVRIGLDPTGTQLTASPYSGAVDQLPPATAWSPYGTQRFVWEQFSVQAEALANQVTAILYAGPELAPNTSDFYSVYMDAASLVHIPFPDNKLPAPASWVPSGFVQVTATHYVTPTLTVTWTTNTPASTQLLYQITPLVITPTAEMTRTAYFPLVQQSQRTPYLDTTPKTSHQVTISGVSAGDTLRFLALSRRPDGSACRTETSYPLETVVGSGVLIVLDPSISPFVYAGGNRW